MPYTGTLSIGEDIPNISDPTKYCIIVACTVTVYSYPCVSYMVYAIAVLPVVMISHLM